LNLFMQLFVLNLTIRNKPNAVLLLHDVEKFY